MKKKFLIGLLSTLCVTLSGCALDAFWQNSSESANEQEPSQIEQVYAQYVVYAQAEGQTPLSYEEWLATIKGEKGEKGDQGIQGEKGDKGDQGEAGKDGVSIVRVEIDENGDMYVVFSDNTKQKVDISYTSHEHTFGEWTPFGDTENVPCQQRLASRICDTCSAIEWKQGAHAWETETIAPTCTEQGYDEKTCTECGTTKKENYTETAEHDWQNEYTTNGTYHWIKCTDCEAIKDKTEHTTDEDGICMVCEQPITATEGILYDVSADGTYAEVIGYEGDATKIKIADTYHNLPVKNIFSRAFNQKGIRSVVIPDSVETISDNAFYNCALLEKVIIGNGVTSIGSSAFESCYSLSSLTLGNNVISIGSSAFRHNDLTSVTIPNSVTSIGSGAFSSCSSLTNLNLGNSITSIGDSAFSRCSALTSISIPDSVTSIGDYAFYGCSNLHFDTYGNAKYLGNESNPYLALIEVVNINYSTYTIHESTKIIAPSAFSDCRRVVNIVIPNSVTSIGGYAFYGCSSLTIYCEAESKPDGWVEGWNGNRPVEWGYKAEE